MRTPQTLDFFHSAVRSEMAQLFEGRDLLLYDMLRYHLGWLNAVGEPLENDGGGKGLRATLCLLANQAVGGNWRQALPAAAAVELVHNFSLIHDDIQDGSPERRHRPTVWRVWGEAHAINAGDSLFALSRLPLYRLKELGVGAEKVLQLEQALDETCLRLCEGQFMDMSFQSRLDISLEDYLEMVEGKTAALMGMTCYAGAFVGTDDARSAQRLRLVGRHLGLAFQIRDDILGIWGLSSTLGKPTAEDVYSRKKSLPVVMAFNAANAVQRRRLEAAYSVPAINEDNAAEVLEIFDALNARGEAQQFAETHYRKAVDALKAISPSNAALDQIEEIARFAIEREF